MNRSVLKSLLFGFTFLIGFIILFSCNRHEKVVENDYPNLVMDSTKSEGFGADVQFSIVKKIDKDTSVVYTLLAAFKGKPVGFNIEVPKITNKNKNGFGNGIVITTSGKNSEYFRESLAEIYRIKADTTEKFVKKTVGSYVDLYAFIKNSSGVVNQDDRYSKKMKLFFYAPDGGMAEIFFNIDKDQKFVEFPEKDPEYRRAVISAFTQIAKEK